MDSKQIGVNAGIVWRAIDATEKKSCSFNELKQDCGLSDMELNRAIGWLAREEKIVINDSEQRISLPYYQFF